MDDVQLKRVRKRLGMTQNAMATALGVTTTFVGMMERGDRPIERRTAMTIVALLLQTDLATADAHGVSRRISELLDGTADGVRAVAAQPPIDDGMRRDIETIARLAADLGKRLER